MRTQQSSKGCYGDDASLTRRYGSRSQNAKRPDNESNLARSSYAQPAEQPVLLQRATVAEATSRAERSHP